MAISISIFPALALQPGCILKLSAQPEASSARFGLVCEARRSQDKGLARDYVDEDDDDDDDDDDVVSWA